LGGHREIVEVSAVRLLPWDYGIRNLFRQPLRSALTALGFVLVVFLLLLVISFVRGLDATLQQSGEEPVILVHSIAAEDNLENSSISDAVPTLLNAEVQDYIQYYSGVPALSPEMQKSGVIETASSRGTPRLAVFRGVRDSVFLARHKVFIVEGRFPKVGEVLVGRLAAAKLGVPADELRIGGTLLIEGQTRTISGWFAAPGAFLEAEIWFPLDDLKTLMKRPNDITLVALRLRPGDRPEQLGAIDYFCRFRHRDLELLGSPETQYYGSLQKHHHLLRVMAGLLASLVVAAGICGAINTMYAAVAGRVQEFAALQAIGFPRRAIALSLLQESTVLAAFATLLASGLAVLLLQGTAIRFTMGAFMLQLDSLALSVGCGAGLAVGVLGAIPPMVRAFRLPVAAALKAV
jgi:ABC-type lipoprotein release transport system permease subunit